MTFLSVKFKFYLNQKILGNDLKKFHIEFRVKILAYRLHANFNSNWLKKIQQGLLRAISAQFLSSEQILFPKDVAQALDNQAYSRFQKDALQSSKTLDFHVSKKTRLIAYFSSLIYLFRVEH